MKQLQIKNGKQLTYTEHEAIDKYGREVIDK